MGFADGFYYGQSRLIVDISDKPVGDIIRVRSLLDPTKVWNREIEEAGDYFVFDVPCKDIYAICLVQDVGGTPTEVITTKQVVGYGETLFVKVVDNDDFIIFDADHRYAANISEANVGAYYNSSATSNVLGHNYGNAGKITFYGKNAGECDCIYLTIDLSKYEGKSLYYKYNVGNGADQTKGFTITSNSKRPILGVCCYYSGTTFYNRYGIGIANVLAPTKFSDTSNDFYDVIHNSGASAPSPFLSVGKIWISE